MQRGIGVVDSQVTCLSIGYEIQWYVCNEAMIEDQAHGILFNLVESGSGKIHTSLRDTPSKTRR